MDVFNEDIVTCDQKLFTIATRRAGTDALQISRGLKDGTLAARIGRGRCLALGSSTACLAIRISCRRFGCALHSRLNLGRVDVFNDFARCAALHFVLLPLLRLSRGVVSLRLSCCPNGAHVSRATIWLRSLLLVILIS